MYSPSINSGSNSSSTLQISPEVVKSFTPTKRFNYHKEASITSLDYDDSGQFLISAGIDKSIQLYDNHKGIHVKDIQSQKYGAHLAKFTHLNKNCLYASTPVGTSNPEEVDHDNSIRYLSLDDNQYLRYFKGHKETVISLEVDPVHDTFLSSSMDLTVKMWDLRSSNPTGNIDTGSPSIVAYDPMGVIFVVGKYSTSTLEFYDITNFDKKPFLTLKVESSIPCKWNKLEFSNNGKLLLVCTNSDNHYIVDAFLGQPLCTLHVPDGAMEFKYPFNGSLTFTPCGRFVLVGSSQHQVHVFDLSSIKTTEGGNVTVETSYKVIKPLKVIETLQGIPKILAFNPKLLTFASADTTVSLWQPLIE